MTPTPKPTPTPTPAPPPTPHFTISAVSGSFVANTNTANKKVQQSVSAGQVIQDTYLDGTTGNVYSATGYGYSIMSDQGTASSMSSANGTPSYTIMIILKNQNAINSDYTANADTIMSVSYTHLTLPTTD